jgi:hypothetical protein
MFSVVDILTPTVNVDIENVSFDPNSKEFQQYEMAVAEVNLQAQEKNLTKDERLAKEMGFDLDNILHGPRVYIRKKVYYQAHAATTHSIEQATNIIEFLGRKYDCEDKLPFAVNLIENGQLLAVAQDNGDFACGKVLAGCLRKVQGFNVLVCVSTYVAGSFVSDILQGQKLHYVKDAADAALDMLFKRLTGSETSESRERACEFKLQITLDPPSSRTPLQRSRPQSTNTPVIRSGLPSRSRSRK